MVLLLAKNAVIAKCKCENAIMTGNYECAYALGVLASKLQTAHKELTDMAALKDELLAQTKTILDDDKLFLRMIEMLREYEVSEQFDSQMSELFLMGQSDGLF